MAAECIRCVTLTEILWWFESSRGTMTALYVDITLQPVKPSKQAMHQDSYDLKILIALYCCTKRVSAIYESRRH